MRDHVIWTKFSHNTSIISPILQPAGYGSKPRRANPLAQLLVTLKFELLYISLFC